MERLNRTIKTRMERLFTYKGNNEWTDDLQALLDSYNNSVHRTIGMKPIDVTAADEKRLFKKMYPKVNIATLPVLRIGDYVRLSLVKNRFEKGYTQSWSEEIFKVVGNYPSNPRTYHVADLLNEPVEGSFYKEELQRVNKPEHFVPEKIVKQRGRGKDVEYLIKWLGYPDKFNTWEPTKPEGLSKSS